MKYSNAATLAACLSCLTSSVAFAPSSSKNLVGKASNSNLPFSTKLFATIEDEKTEAEDKNKLATNEVKETEIDPDAEGLPWWWDLVWKLNVMKPTEPGTDCQFGDSANVLKSNIEQIYGGYPSLDGCPLAEGDIADIADGTQFIGLQKYYNDYGSPYKLCFGPKSFLVISDPVQAKHVLRDANKLYDKGLLAGKHINFFFKLNDNQILHSQFHSLILQKEILEPIMGKGLIPADPVTWKNRRRQIVPAFHRKWLDHMVGLFGYCNEPLIKSLNNIVAADGKVEMEEKFCSVALDIIGKSVFNYEFDSVTKESPVVKAVYRAFLEVEYRSLRPLPYWDLPFANQLVPRLRAFNSDLELLNDILSELIDKAKNTRIVEDIEELENRDYANVKDPSLLRFLVDMRGADIDNKQLRDDLMTMLIAGHETTAAVLTWALFELLRNPECMKEAQAEIDRIVGDRSPTLQDIKEMKYLRMVVAETLRLYPQPPLLIRRCRTENIIPKGGGREATCIRGMDMFLALYNIHRDEKYWPEATKFDPMRFTRKYSNPDIPEWEGFDPAKWENNLYPNEVASDFAYLPFGGGARKCIGDEFATLEATVTLAMVLRRYDFEFDKSKGTTEQIMDEPFKLEHPVGMRSGATIHTRKGLNLIVKKRGE